MPYICMFQKNMQYRGVGCCRYRCRAVQSLRLYNGYSSHASSIINIKSLSGDCGHSDCMAIVIMLFLVLIVAIVAYASIAQKKNQEKIIKREERQQRIKEREERQQKEFEHLLEKRTQEFGSLTKCIHIAYNKENDIYVYENSKTIYILGNKYSFNDFLSCSIEKEIVSKGQKKMVTKPDFLDMATQELLYGHGKKYNVESKTEIYETPDIIKYIIYIGLNSLSTPQISIRLDSSYRANEVCNLINAIIANQTK